LLSENEVVGHGEREHEALEVAVLGHVRDPACARALGVVAGDVDPPDEDRTGGRLAQTEDGLSELALAVPADAGDPQDLASSHFEVDALQLRGAAVAPRLESAHGKDHFISWRRGALH